MGVFSYQAQRYPSSASAPIAPIKLSAPALSATHQKQMLPLSAGIKNNTREEKDGTNGTNGTNWTNWTNRSFFSSSAASPIERSVTHQALALPIKLSAPPTVRVLKIIPA